MDTVQSVSKSLKLVSCALTSMRFTRQGQSCTAASRIYVERPIFDRFVKAMTDAVNGMVMGDPLDEKTDTSSGLLQKHLPTSRVVKAFNHIQAASIATDGTPAGTSNRRALALAGDDPEALEFAQKLYDQFGFDAVVVGGLADSWRVETNQPAYGVRQNADELRANLAIATR